MISDKIFAVETISASVENDRSFKNFQRNVKNSGKRLFLNGRMLYNLKEKIFETRDLFSSSLEEMNDLIDGVNKTASSLSAMVRKEVPEDFGDLKNKVIQISDGIQSIGAAVAPLRTAGADKKSWVGIKNEISDLSSKAVVFSVKKDVVPFVDLGEVTKDNIGNALQEKVIGSFGAVKGTLEGSEVSGWWLKKNNSGSGMLFDQRNQRILSLFLINDTVDIKVIWGTDLGMISDLSQEEKQFVQSLISAGLNKEVWNKAVADITLLQERHQWLERMSVAGLSKRNWADMAAAIIAIKSSAAVISAVKNKNFSLNSWEKVMSVLWKEDNDVLTEKQQSFIDGLMSADLSAEKWDEMSNDIRSLFFLQNDIKELGDITADDWKEVYSCVQTLKTFKEMISQMSGLSPAIWSMILERMVGMTTEERTFLNNLMSSTLTDETWSKALEDILALQSARTFVNDLIDANLSADSWTQTKSDIRDLLEVKAFVDSLKAADFTVDNWSLVYSAALSSEVTLSGGNDSLSGSGNDSLEGAGGSEESLSGGEP